MAGPPALGPRRKVKFEDGSSTDMTPAQYDEYMRKGKAMGADMKKTPASKGGRDNSGPEINAMNAPDRLGKVRRMVQLKRPLNPVVDKRTVKEKLRDASARRN